MGLDALGNRAVHVLVFLSNAVPAWHCVHDLVVALNIGVGSTQFMQVAPLK